MTMETPQEAIQMMREAQSTARTGRTAFRASLARQTSGNPIVWLGADTRPDVSDLIRVHRSEGSGDITSRWLYTKGTYFLRCEMNRPVRASFWLAFPMPQLQMFLTLAVHTHVIAVVVTPPPLWAMDKGETSYPSSQNEARELLIEALTIDINHRELPWVLTREI